MRLCGIAFQSQCLTRLKVGTLEVPPSNLTPLATLTDLAHISWTVVGQTGLVMSPVPQYLSHWASWGLPLAQLCIRGAVLDPADMRHIGQCR